MDRSLVHWVFWITTQFFSDYVSKVAFIDTFWIDTSLHVNVTARGSNKMYWFWWIMPLASCSMHGPAPLFPVLCRRPLACPIVLCTVPCHMSTTWCCPAPLFNDTQNVTNLNLNLTQNLSCVAVGTDGPLLNPKWQHQCGSYLVSVLHVYFLLMHFFCRSRF